MTASLKTCYVRLNRNFLVSEETLKINASVERTKNSDSSNNSICIPSPSEMNDGSHSKLRKQEEIKYSEESKNSCSETSDSEFSDDETTIQIRKKKLEDSIKINCRHCDKSFNTYPSYLIHKRSHQSKQFQCIICQMTFKERQSFVNHMKRLHPEVKPFVCDYPRCVRSFKTQTLLRMHNKSHLRYMCRFCKKGFGRKHLMRKHVLETH